MTALCRGVHTLRSALTHSRPLSLFRLPAERSYCTANFDLPPDLEAAIQEKATTSRSQLAQLKQKYGDFIFDTVTVKTALGSCLEETQFDHRFFVLTAEIYPNTWCSQHVLLSYSKWYSEVLIVVRWNARHEATIVWNLSSRSSRWIILPRHSYPKSPGNDPKTTSRFASHDGSPLLVAINRYLIESVELSLIK